MLQTLIEKGPTYREKNSVNWDKVREEINKGIKQCRKDWSIKEKTNPTYLDEWYHSIMIKVDNEIDTLKKSSKRKSRFKKVLDDDDIKKELNRLQEKYVFVPTDKASNNISII